MIRPLISILLPKMSGGGISRTRAALAKGLLETGEVRVEFVLEKNNGVLQHIIPDEASIHVLGPQRFRNMVRSLRSYMRDRQPAVMLTSKELHAFAALLARRGITPRVAVFPTLHGDFEMRLRQNRTRSEAIWLPLAVRWFYRVADSAIGVSEGVSDSLRMGAGLSPEDVTTIFNPFDLTNIRKLSAAQPVFHPWLEQDRAHPCLVAAGRLSVQKDYGTLLQAMARLVQKQRPVRLVILGEGPRRLGLEAMIRDLSLEHWVALPGFTDNPFPNIAAADAFVLSSLWEGLPGVLVQALALGRPVVSTDCPHGPREILKDGALGGLVPVGDDEALAKAICMALDRPVEAERLRSRAQDFGVRRITDQYLDLFRAHGGL